MVLVSITRLRLRAWSFWPMFAWYVFRSARQASKAEGKLAARLLRERRNTFWTATRWTSEGAMKKFMISGAHGKSMRKLAKWCDEAAGAHWNQENSDLPTWLDTYVRLPHEGPPAKVYRPSRGPEA